jgi:DNA polymerase III epsilon subunit-like protein
MIGKEVYFSVDVEASGPVPGEYSMLSLGACRVDDFETTFYAELKPVSERFVSKALEVSGFDLGRLSREGREAADVMRSFQSWVVEQSLGATPVFVGFNAPFDWSFVNWYFHKFVGKNPFGLAALDIKAYYMGMSGCLWEDTKSSRLPEYLQASRTPGSEHNSLSDAVYQATMFRRMLSERGRSARE